MVSVVFKSLTDALYNGNGRANCARGGLQRGKAFEIA
jgi:hypothetical protein